MISAALQQFCANRLGISYIATGTPWNNGYIESFNRRLRVERLNRNHWNTLLEARVIIGDSRTGTTCGIVTQRWAT
ncbi:integrase core domain-containing protein [Nocardia beijingensis]|uniref:integrase core domain-containing protein n=1 Tax=Nocardia beijingensis TaxID=95162 RepID=UPI001E4CB6B8|nr:integrase core domain-containing protein [Nocardia beijingensis]